MFLIHVVVGVPSSLRLTEFEVLDETFKASE